MIERETNTRFRYPATLTGLDRVTVRNIRLMLEGHVVAHPTDTQFGATLTGALGSDPRRAPQQQARLDPVGGRRRLAQGPGQDDPCFEACNGWSDAPAEADGG